MTIDILVVEDKEHHLNDVKAMIQKRIDAGVDINVIYAETYEEAREKIECVDGIISDVFIPKGDGTSPEAWGKRIIYDASCVNKYIVLCTDGWHHGPQLQEIHNKASGEVAAGKKEFYLGMIDRVDEQNKSIEMAIEYSHKNWPRAYFTLMNCLDPIEAKQFVSSLVDLGIDTKRMLRSYWGPSNTDLNKIYQD